MTPAVLRTSPPGVGMRTLGLALAESVEQQRAVRDRLVAGQPELTPDTRRRPDPSGGRAGAGRPPCTVTRRLPAAGDLLRGGRGVGRRLASLGRPRGADDGREHLLPLLGGQDAAVRGRGALQQGALAGHVVAVVAVVPRLLDRDGQLGALLDERREPRVDVVDAPPQPREVTGRDGLGHGRCGGRLAQVLEPAQVVHEVAELGEGQRLLGVRLAPVADRDGPR